MTDENGMVEFRDFTATKAISFKLGDRVYECLPVIPIATAADLARLGENMNELSGQEKVERMLGFFEAVMTDESASHFRAMSMDPKSPLGVKQFGEIISWLLEVYGLRPTQAPSASSSGSASEGTSTPSTDGAPAAA